jgi:gamma-glutamylcyclotransferase (GGCT)/AIG2-like uncharacterized protein YtfP
MTHPNPQFNLAVYGTLMSTGGAFRSGVLEQYADRVGPCVIPGKLFAVHYGAFPALMPGNGQVKGELWRARSLEDLVQMLRTTDSIESYNPHRETQSMYLRRLVTLEAPDTQAWTYQWNYGYHGLIPIHSGDWLAWRNDERDAVAS